MNVEPDVAASAAGGLTVAIEEPFHRLRVRFGGSVNLLDDPSAMADPKRALQTSPVVECHIELTLSAVAPPYEESFDGDGESFAPNHYEQLVSVRGIVVIEANRWTVDGFGLRDHSWGPRSWQAPWFYRWLHGESAGVGFMAAYFGSRDGAPLDGGFVWDGDTVRRARVVEIRTIRDDAHEQLETAVTLDCDGDTWTFIGRVESAIPLRNRRPAPDGGEELITRIIEGSTVWTSGDGARLTGMTEYLDQIIDGAPVGIAV